jgi:hypothetical protein
LDAAVVETVPVTAGNTCQLLGFDHNAHHA